MSDRLAVMNQGRIAQLGTPADVYAEPADAYVADFLGVSNLMDAIVARAGGAGELTLGDFRLAAGCGDASAGATVKLAIRPERIHLRPHDASGPNHIPGMVERLVFLGSTTQIYLRLANGTPLQTLVPNDGSPLPWGQGTPVKVALPADALRVLADPGSSVAEIHEGTLGDSPALADPASV